MRLDKFHYFEFADRINVIRKMLEDHIQLHPAAAKDVRIVEALEAAQDLLGDAYQLALDVIHSLEESK